MNRHTFTRAGIAATATLALSVSLASAVQAQYTCTIAAMEPNRSYRVRGIDKNGNDAFVGERSPNSNTPRGRLWNSSTQTPLNMHPGVLSASTISGISSGQMVGFGSLSANGIYSTPLAFLWTSAGIGNTLHPTGYSVSNAYGICDNFQVGSAVPTGEWVQRAILWNGTAASAVSLHPSGARESVATAVSRRLAGVYEQGGWASVPGGPNGGFQQHAYLWSGTAASGVDLHPAHPLDDSWSWIQGMSEIMQVGALMNFSPWYMHAYLWYGTPGSAVNLNPSGYDGSFASDCAAWKEEVAGGGYRTIKKQVGTVYGTPTSNQRHAAVWSGSASSMIDLHLLIPTNGPQIVQSYATGINKFDTIVGYGEDAAGRSYPLIWRSARSK
jgi:hypothetical protein